jgi:hypothetical protein
VVCHCAQATLPLNAYLTKVALVFGVTFALVCAPIANQTFSAGKQVRALMAAGCSEPTSAQTQHDLGYLSYMSQHHQQQQHCSSLSGVLFKSFIAAACQLFWPAASRQFAAGQGAT